MTRRRGWTAIAVAVVVTAVVPLTAIAAASPSPVTDRATMNATSMPIPANMNIRLSATENGRRVALTWNELHPAGGPVFYRVWRARTPGFSCPPQTGAPLCNVTMPEVGVTRKGAFTDKAPRGRWFYRVAVAANWLNDPQYGDPYLLSSPVAVTIK